MQYKHCETGGDCVGGIDFPEELATFPASFSITFSLQSQTTLQFLLASQLISGKLSRNTGNEDHMVVADLGSPKTVRR